MNERTPVLEVQDLVVEFANQGQRGRTTQAVDKVSLTVDRAEVVGLVGESGSGKSTLANAVLGLVAPTGGRILLNGRDISCAGRRERRRLARHVQVIFQDPYSSLNPSRTVGATLAQPLRLQCRLSRTEVLQRVALALDHVGLPADAATRYPAQFSGGQRQRIAIARALMLEPDLVICDEPTSALDMSVQAQILNLLLELQQRLGLAYLFISHDIDVVRHVSDRVCVMLNGRLVEEGAATQVTDEPCHPYTQALLAAAPVPDPARQAQRRARRAQHGPADSPPPARATSDRTGCLYVSRCPLSTNLCVSKRPHLRAVEGGVRVACHAVHAKPGTAGASRPEGEAVGVRT